MSESIAARSWVVRQERFSLGEDHFRLVLNEKPYEILNFSATGVAFVCDHPLEFGQEAQIELTFTGMKIFSARAKVARSQPLPNGQCEIALGFSNQVLPIELIHALMSSVSSFEKEKEILFPAIPEQIFLKTLRVKDFLEGLEKQANTIEDQIKTPNGSLHLYDSIEKGVIDWLVAYISPSLDKLFTELNNLVRSQPEAERPTCYEFIREKLGSILYRAPLPWRTYSKPLGYAGDYQMMNLMYHSDKSAATNLFTKAINAYYASRPAAMAVKNRSYFLKDKITQFIRNNPGKRLRIMSLASGPARELALVLESVPRELLDQVEFYLIDQDLESLQYAQRSLRQLCFEKGCTPDIQFLNTNIKTIIRRGLPVTDLDLIYSAGLFDYFSDPVAVLTAKRIAGGLREGGMAIIGNFDTSNPDMAQMEIVLDWQLIYRSEEDLKTLFGGITDDITVERENAGVNLFAILRKR